MYMYSYDARINVVNSGRLAKIIKRTQKQEAEEPSVELKSTHDTLEHTRASWLGHMLRLLVARRHTFTVMTDIYHKKQ